MARRAIHYEAAFEDYLRNVGVPHIAIDEAKKAAFAEGRVKSFDFLVYPTRGGNRLVDVKGRKWPATGEAGGRRWENWVTAEDLDGLSRWQNVFGDGVRAELVFAYWGQAPDPKCPLPIHHSFRGRQYAFLTVAVDTYRASARPRSARWSTVAIPVATFRQMAVPVPDAWLDRSGPPHGDDQTP